MLRRTVTFSLALAALAAAPSVARAQGFAIGPRFTFVRGALATDESPSRFLGGTMRLPASPRVAVELALDYRTYKSDDLTARVRETPFQGSLLLFPARGAFAPYLVGGIGIYNRMYDQLDSLGAVVATTSERKIGWHLGAGAELRVGPHAALYGDYRLRFVKFGTPEAGSQTIAIPGLDKLKVSHQGSMWTSGIAFYF